MKHTEECTSFKLQRIGESMGVILPKHLLDRLNIAEGDSLYCVQTPLGFELTPSDPELAHQMDLAVEIARENSQVLRRLSQ